MAPSRSRRKVLFVGQDITGVAIAPLDSELLIRIDTAGPSPATL
jgi:hypothetical protein